MATILVVGGKPSYRQPLVTLLQSSGHRALEAPNGERALELVRTEQPELVLTDILMPDMDACELVIHLRAATGPSRPRIMLRAANYLEDEGRRLAQACEVTHVINRDDEAAAVLATIESALSPSSPGPVEAPPSPDAFAAHLRAAARKLHERLEDLEISNADAIRSMTEYASRLEVVRSALEEEVNKRIWAEKGLTEANHRLREQALRDPLTGLYNRRYLEESLEREVSRVKRTGLTIGLMMIDIDYFKQCNDQFGHLAGDAMLRAVAQYVLSLARGEDILCRYGGEEFVLVMANASLRAVWERAEELRLGVQELKVEYGGRNIGPVTISIGIAMLPEHGESGPIVLQAADAALYRAKQTGRNRIIVGDGARVG